MDNSKRARLGPFHAASYPAAIVAAFAFAAWLAWGFTVDDALIPARYAVNLREGLGYRFNAAGPVTDGVTPLGWAVLLVPFARDGAIAALQAAQAIGAVAMIAAVAWLGVNVGEHARATASAWSYAAGLVVCTSAPLAAWAVAGLETGVVTAIATAGVLARERGRHRAGVALVGVAAAMRPEMLPWALFIAFPRGPGGKSTEAQAPDLATFARLGLAALPFGLVAVTRGAVFGQLAPLSVYAKAPDAGLGARYALACFLLTGPVALIAPFAWRRLSAWPAWLVASIAVHFAAVAAAGGDWMPLSRLAVPVLPTVALAASYVAAAARPWATAFRITLVVCGNLFVWGQVGLRAAEVGADRRALIEEMGPILRDAAVVATLDAGWVGAAAPAATVVDLAGVTDPTVAALGGGHTTRPLSPRFFDDRGVELIVLLLRRGTPVADPWWASTFDRGGEVWIASMPAVAEGFDLAYAGRAEKLPYIVVRRRVEREAHRSPPAGGSGFHWQAESPAALSRHVAAGRGPHAVLRPRRDPRPRRGGGSTRRGDGLVAGAPARGAGVRAGAARTGGRLAARFGAVGGRRRGGLARSRGGRGAPGAGEGRAVACRRLVAAG